MTGSLMLPDGRAVVLGDRAPGGSRNHTRYGVLSTGEQVVVKTHAGHGRLPAEAAALRHLAGHRLRVPRVVSFGTDGDGSCVLVMTRESGTRPTGPGGWYRLGRDLAGLLRVPVEDPPLPLTTAPEFVTEHRQRLEMVAALLGEGMRGAIAAAIDQFESSGRLVLTHGDPGSGNYLEHEDGGVILDWETASVGPHGIDAGRAAFIALLDNGHTGIPEELHRAVVRGYRDGLPAGCALDRATLSAATVVAGLQFIHDRHVEPLRPDRTPQVAIDVLAAYLDNC